MFRPISGHPRVYNWSLMHTEKETIIEAHKTKRKLLKFMKVISRKNMCQ